jgi:DNA mismatch repair protein MSH2
MDEKAFQQLASGLDSSATRFFDVGDKYLLQGTDAQNAADQVFHTTTVLKYWHKNLPVLFITKPICHSYIVTLITTQAQRIEIWENKGGWVCDKKASPGNCQSIEDLIYTSEKNIPSSIVLAVRFNQKEG